MTKRKEHFDEDSAARRPVEDLRIPSKLPVDLKSLFEPQVGIPPEVDHAVMDRANKHFAALESDKVRRLRVNWAWRIAAAAAVVIFAFSLDLTKQTGPATDSFLMTKTQAVDIDRNGRVDILDAFKLAKNIESAGNTETKWDINGDGLVDRSDVDMVAFAAVRLDKGVL